MSAASSWFRGITRADASAGRPKASRGIEMPALGGIATHVIQARTGRVSGSLRRILLRVCLAGSIASLSLGSSGPYLVGERTRDVTPDDLSELRALSARYGTAWLVAVQDSFFVNSPNLYARLYLIPDSHSSTLRR